MEPTEFVKSLKILFLSVDPKFNEEEFNLFRILRNETDEENLHSAFLAFMLNPNEVHGLGEFPIISFIKAIDNFNENTKGVFDDFETKTVVCQTEFGVKRKNAKSTRRIDILIRNNLNQSIAIENKIWAGDQPRQLEDYYESLTELGDNVYPILYLTLDGKDPSKSSIGSLVSEKFQAISYSELILDWISLVIKEAAELPTLRESLIQYKFLVEDLCGLSMRNKTNATLVKFSSSKENILKMKDLIGCWSEVQANIQILFWKQLEQSIEEKIKHSKGYSLLESQRWSEENVVSYVKKWHDNLRKRSWYGIKIEIPTNEKSTNRVMYYVELDHSISGGFIVQNGNMRETVKDSGIAQSLMNLYIKNEVSTRKFTIPGENDKWIAWRYLKVNSSELNQSNSDAKLTDSGKLNFKEFRSPQVLLMTDDQYRKIVCDRIASEVIDDIQDVLNKLQ